MKINVNVAGRVYSSDVLWSDSFGVTSGQSMEVEFTSDYSVQYGGFYLIYMEVDRVNLRKFKLFYTGI